MGNTGMLDDPGLKAMFTLMAKHTPDPAERERMAKTIAIEALKRASRVESVETHWLSGAVLDVFDEEPLPRDHPYWSCPGIYVTPHISGDTNIKEAVAEFCENLSRFRAGQPLNLLVDKERGF